MTHWYAPGAKAIIKRESPAGWPKELRESDFEVVRVSVTE
jgi:hypothetical protein